MSAYSEPFIRRGIGLLGGTFDPVHNGHLALAHEALEQLHLARVDFIPAAAPWQKSRVTSAEKRLRLLEDALAHEPMLRVNPIELLRSGPTYTIDTLIELREEYGPHPALVLILGADQWKNFHTWKDWDCFLDYCNIVVSNRDDQKPSACEAVTAWAQPHVVPARELSTHSRGRVAFIGIPAHAASSTKIRQLFAELPRYDALKRLEQWLPARVAYGIARYHLY